ncbi:peptidoglycan-associated lipoprotein Pal [Lutibaculum baratangense]|uniref:Peptidoglycan-associated lipoprotein n=1 Tax=Lutibaculum baratangense AMV1 TaxID=631454 RepID=V4TJU4_9HYPH|nr:peptidoglycan-associated lipoprotein Pal [Lutibaculum baratangense]ESR26173.1 Outer membrane lipoprotein omp16 precursor [Lutibaculum baratangense AMV1]
MSRSMLPRALRIVAIVAMASLAAACAQKQQGVDGQAGLGGPGGPGSAAPGSAQDFTVNVGDRVFFETDSTSLTPQARETLNRQGQWLRSYSRYSILVEGHADERGTREYNLALGARRAQVVRDYLASQGVDASRIRTVSYGKERPVAVCDNISCWSQNRRAVTVLN